MTDVAQEAAADIAATSLSTDIPPATASYRRFALVLLMIIYMLNFLDRSVINILAESIKRDLHLSDLSAGWVRIYRPMEKTPIPTPKHR